LNDSCCADKKVTHMRNVSLLEPDHRKVVLILFSYF
jgi:hypothetical protein